jgi:hypothetical protein
VGDELLLLLLLFVWVFVWMFGFVANIGDCLYLSIMNWTGIEVTLVAL